MQGDAAPRFIYQRHTRYMPARHHAAALLAYAQARDLPDEALLRGTGLVAGELLQLDTLLSPDDIVRLLVNLGDALAEPDTAFVLGSELLPGQHGELSHALLRAVHLRQALEILIAHQGLLSPLLVPHLLLQDGKGTVADAQGGVAVLHWTDAGLPAALRPFVVDLMMAAVNGMSRWLSGERLPWRFRFNRTQPAHLEQYRVHLGPDVRFNDYLDAMYLPLEWLERPWPRGSSVAVSAALAGVTRAQRPRGLLSALYDWLHERARLAPTLEQASQAFGVSPATFKRQLAAHGTHFQAELDQARAHAIWPLIHQGCDNEQIAAWLGFHDANNFRRSFKRWTGLPPSGWRERWGV
ncbi:AraC family transcriptional regulator ligand-binding domain-containing protein [Hylemonella sp. W303a]|uniref:AraC family transcriptional regulator n=1 Tax=Hylemonella sp. W303a TaxID=3389873 RepID=UPI00396B153B